MNKIRIGNGEWPFSVSKKDLEISHYKGSGAGGQLRNKVSSGVMIKHIPTGIMTRCCEHREQSKNKIEAFRKLAEQLIPIMKKEARKERYLAGDTRVRSYKKKEDLVIDERLNEVYSYKEVLDGKGLEDLLEDLVLTNKKQIN